MFILFRKFNRRDKGFTLIELLVVIAIIGILSTLAVLALGNARIKARDAKRMSDISQIGSALSLYYSDSSSYPLIITPGQPLTSPDGSVTYIAKIPSNPLPRVDGACSDRDYTYAATQTGNDYKVYFCLGSEAPQLSAGGKKSTPSGLADADILPLAGTCGGQQNGTCAEGKECCMFSDGSCYGFSYGCDNIGMCPGMVNFYCTHLGDACSSYVECESGLCDNGVCVCRDINAFCDYNSNCCSNNCSYGVCGEEILEL